MYTYLGPHNERSDSAAVSASGSPISRPSTSPRSRSGKTSTLLFACHFTFLFFIYVYISFHFFQFNSIYLSFYLFPHHKILSLYLNLVHVHYSQFMFALVFACLCFVFVYKCIFPCQIYIYIFYSVASSFTSSQLICFQANYIFHISFSFSFHIT